MPDSEYLLWLQEARRLLTDACGLQLGAVRVLIYYDISKHGIEFTLPPTEPAGWPAGVVNLTDPPPVAADRPLRRVHRRILEVATATPIAAKQLARLAGYRRANTYVRTALAELVRWGRLTHTPDGYRLPA